MNSRESISEGPGNILSITFTHLLSPLRYLFLSFEASLHNTPSQSSWKNSAFGSIREITINEDLMVPGETVISGRFLVATRSSVRKQSDFYL